MKAFGGVEGLRREQGWLTVDKMPGGKSTSKLRYFRPSPKADDPNRINQRKNGDNKKCSTCSVKIRTSSKIFKTRVEA